MTVNDGSLVFKCVDWKENHDKEFDKDLVKRFENTYTFCERDINKFCLILWKGIYSYEYMDSWQRLNKKAFYSNLAMKDITDADYKHAQKGFQNTELRRVS